MKKTPSLFGGILLVIGTAIGGGMLALPIATAEAGFFNALILMLVCWLMMTASAFLVLETNLWLPANTNIISMAKTILGPWGAIIAWINYLLLFYSVLAAYMAGGGDFLHNLLSEMNINLPYWLTTLLFTGLLSTVVYRGIYYVDYFNRGLMLTKLSVYILLIIFIIPFISKKNLIDSNTTYYMTAGLTVMVTSFTFANIIPSLRTYFKDDVKKLRQVIFIGSLIPLICYALWNLVIMGVIPRTSDHGLIKMLHTNHSNTEFIAELSRLLSNRLITTLAYIFTSICLATSFLASGLGLSDFLADGLQLSKRGRAGIIIYTITFLPSLIIVLFYPNIFIKALSYAGIYCVLLFGLLPALMAWHGRYNRRDLFKGHQIQVKGGKYLLSLLILSFSFVIFYAVWKIIMI